MSEYVFIPNHEVECEFEEFTEVMNVPDFMMEVPDELVIPDEWLTMHGGAEFKPFMFPVWERCVKDNVEWLVGSVGLECVVPDAEHSLGRIAIRSIPVHYRKNVMTSTMS